MSDLFINFFKGIVMKRFLSLALICIFWASNAAYAQNTNTHYGGQQGEFSLSVNAEPILNFTGNILNGSANNNFNTEDLLPSISGRYFITNQIALNAGLSINNKKTKAFSYGQQQKPDQVTGTNINKTSNWMFGIGAQYLPFSGKRLQSFVGAGLVIGKENNTIKYAAISDDTFQRKTANVSNTIGIALYLGIEYFLWQNISISTTVDIGAYSTTHKEIAKDSPDKNNTNYTRKTNKATLFGSNLMEGNLALNFYF